MKNATETDAAATDGNRLIVERKPNKAKRPAKPKAKKKTTKVVRAKPKAKRPAAKKVAKRKTAAKPKDRHVTRPERLDMRLTKAEKTKIVAKAKKTRRTVTSLIIEAIERIR